MPISIVTQEAPAFLMVTMSGKWPTVQEQKGLRRQLVERGHLAPETRTLVDIRTVDPLPRFEDVDAAMVAAEHDEGTLPKRIAFLVRPGAHFGVGRMLQSLAPPGVAMELFEDEAAARDWLTQQ